MSQWQIGLLAGIDSFSFTNFSLLKSRPHRSLLKILYFYSTHISILYARNPQLN